MSHTKGKKYCSCGNPQSSPIPHEHDQTDREKAIIKHFETRSDELVEALEGLFNDCRNTPHDDQRGKAMEKAREALLAKVKELI